MLRRQLASPVRYEPTDRFWFAALSALIPLWVPRSPSMQVRGMVVLSCRRWVGGISASQRYRA
ncbi:hypothetical protein GCM10009753_79950 [Streptantibioticus ferralitis]